MESRPAFRLISYWKILVIDNTGQSYNTLNANTEMGKTIVLKYFATNRDMDKLGRAVKVSSERHKLSRGGYYFVDMEKYMRYYLGTTDADEMPKGALVTDSEKEVFDSFVNDSRVGSIVVCVHGFNVKLFEAFTWFRVLTDTMKHLPDVGDRVITAPEDIAKNETEQPGSLTAFIGFSWPSNGNVLSYPSDQKEAIASKAAFGALLVRLKATKKSVKLICHSMGNFLACHTFVALVNELMVPPAAIDNEGLNKLIKRGEKKADSEDVERNDWLVDTYVMIAPDIERRHITKCAGAEVETDYVGPFYSGLQHLVKKKVNMYSRFDGALSVSNIEKGPRKLMHVAGDTASSLTLGLLDFLERNPDQKWEKRLGETPAPVNAPPGFVSVNATELANRKIDHSDHIDSAHVVARIAKELEI